MLTDLSLDDWFWSSVCLAPFLAFAAAAFVIVRIRGKQSKIRSYVFATIVFGITFLLVISSVRIPMFLLVKTDQASAGARVTLDQLPRPNGMKLVDILNESFFSDVERCCCSYGRSYLLYGTSRPQQEALETYTQALLASGWTASGEQYETNHFLVRGLYESINISSGGDGGYIWGFGKHPSYRAAKNEFPNLIVVGIDYILPSRRECP
ncbi:MAG TPA: hypothetical protein VLG46_17010 [Anaerolineae bacterium]|nr:hypothetical protein [Anaerolineae bacterium]